MKNDFNENAPASLDDLFAKARDATLFYITLKNPAQKVYEKFAKAIDQYVEAFRNEYGSLQEYIEKQEQPLLALAAQKGIFVKKRDIFAGDEEEIKRLNDQIYTKGAMIDYDAFAELFILRLPAHVSNVTKLLKKIPDVSPHPHFIPKEP